MKLDLTANLGQLPALLAVAELRSFTRAAAALGVSTSAISQTIARLEAAVGTPLVVRTTRSVALTDAGERLAGDARPAITAATAALSATRERTGELTGMLRLNVPRLGYKLAIDRLILAYLRAHPRMQLDVTIEDRSVDIVATGYDAGVRLHEMVQRDMVSVKLTGELRFVVVAAPGYLAAHGRPKHPRDLVEHECLAKRSPTSGIIHPWEFERGKQPLEVQVRGRLVASDVEVLRDAACAGLGLTYLPETDARADLDAGRLVTVLEPYLPPVPGLYLYFPRAARTVPKLAAFIACARELLG